MTDKEMVLYLINKASNIIEYEDSNNIEINNFMYGENISFEFDLDGNIIRIYS